MMSSFDMCLLTRGLHGAQTHSTELALTGQRQSALEDPHHHAKQSLLVIMHTRCAEVCLQRNVVVRKAGRYSTAWRHKTEIAAGRCFVPDYIQPAKIVATPLFWELALWFTSRQFRQTRYSRSSGTTSTAPIIFPYKP
jgi:hypothetical protein